jgi:hypothetical protein
MMRLLSKKVVTALRRVTCARYTSLISAPTLPLLITAPQPLLIAAPPLSNPPQSDGNRQHQLCNTSPPVGSSLGVTTPPSPNSRPQSDVVVLSQSFRKLNFASNLGTQPDAFVHMASQPPPGPLINGIPFSHTPGIGPCLATHHYDGGYTLIPISQEAKNRLIPTKNACLFNLRHVALLHGFQLTELEPQNFAFSSSPPAGDSPGSLSSPSTEDLPLIGPSPAQHALLQSIHIGSDVDMADPDAVARQREIDILHLTLDCSLRAAVASGALDPISGAFNSTNRRELKNENTP